MTHFRSLLFNALFIALLLVMGVVCLPCLLWRGERREWLAKTWIRIALWLLKWVAGIDYTVRGEVTPQPSQPYLYAAKHQSAFETMALYLLIDRPVFVLKRELLWIPIFGWYLKWVGCIAIDRSKGAEMIPHMIEQAKAMVAQGRSIIIFPEGTRRPVGAPPKYKRGIAHLAAALNVPTIPVALNAGQFWPRNSFKKHSGTIMLSFLNPLRVYTEKDAFLYDVQEVIEQEMARLSHSPLEGDSK